MRVHRLSAAVFLAYWLVVFGLAVFGWQKAANRLEDMVRTVIYLHLSLPILAGAIVSIRRRRGPGSISGGMLAGGVVLTVDAAALLTHKFIAFHLEEFELKAWTGIFEGIALLIGIGLAGSLLGLLGALGGALLGRLIGIPKPPAVDGPQAEAVPRRMLLTAGGLVLGAALVVALFVIPPVTQERAETAFAVNAILNALLGFAALAPFAPRRTGRGRALVTMGAFAALLLGAALLDAAALSRVTALECARRPSPVSAARRAISGRGFWLWQRRSVDDEREDAPERDRIAAGCGAAREGFDSSVGRPLAHG